MKTEVSRESLKTLVRESVRKEPNFYQVIMHNDDFTPMEFVVSVLERFFCTNRLAATQIMLEAHMSGRAVCGVYTRDVAESKIAQVIDYSRINEHTLICSMEVAQ